MKKYVLLVLVICLMVMISGCTDTTSNDIQNEQTEELMQQAVAQVGMPNITAFTEKKILKDIYELCDDANLITYAYTQNMNGKFVYIGQCVGFGVPYSAQFSNPESLIRTFGDYYILPQAEPNGIFKPEGLTATWLIVINPETGEREVEYWEPTIIVKQSKLPARLCEDWSLPSGY